MRCCFPCFWRSAVWLWPSPPIRRIRSSPLIFKQRGEGCLDGCVSGRRDLRYRRGQWYLDGDGIYYFLLPTSADLSSITVYHNFDSVQIGAATLESGKPYSLFENGGSYTLRADGKQYSVKVLQSSRIGSMFLTTESGSMDYIHANKENKESGSLLLIDTDGSISYDGKLDQIKGRGNTTWTNIEKKPYNIKLAKKTALMGMAKSKNGACLQTGRSIP